MTFKPQDSINGNSKTLAQKQSAVKPTQTESSASSVEACPFIGLEDDPSTRLLFVSPAACCHRAEPVSAIDLGHQQAYCLSSIHKLCPVLMRPEWGPLPPEIEYHEVEVSSTRKRWFWWVLALILLGLFMGGLFLWGNGRFPSAIEFEPEESMPVVLVASTNTPTSTPTVMASTTPLPTKTAVPEPTLTASAAPTILPTATLVPTYTPVPPTKTAVPPIIAVVNVDRLNVRSGPGVDYDLVATIDEGETVELTGRLINGSWWQICCMLGESGWVIGEAVDLPADAENLVPVIENIPLPPTS